MRRSGNRNRDLKYRLYDIDVVINKTIVFGVLAAFITAVYVAIVVGLGQTLGSSDEPNLALSIAATAIVAIGFQPVRERIQRLANRLVYGQRSTPYEALKALTQRVASSVETERVASHIAQTLADVTGAEVTRVWLALDHRLVPAASYPENGERPEALTLDGTAALPPIDDADHVVPVHHHGELLGALTLTKKRGEQVTPSDERVARDLASQTGVVLRNTRLTAELQARLDQISAQADEIRTSRQRIVATQDAERRRLERDIHDGAQQHLVALAVKLRLAKTMTEKKPDKATAMLDQLEAQMDDALSTLDELARGIYPPLLEQRGIAEALSARRDGAPMEITVEDRTASRFDPAIELATYFCCLEALQNVAKYAEARNVQISLRQQDGELRFAVTDDGRGFDPETTPKGSRLQNMADRLAALGGSLEIASKPGSGTTVTGRVPIRELEPVR